MVKTKPKFKQMRGHSQAARTCGGCQECCVRLGIEELDKPPMHLCPHMVGGGCGIYANRPHSCKHYACLWVIGVIPEQFKPEKIGVIIDQGVNDKQGNPAKNCFVVRETREGAIRNNVDLLAWMESARQKGITFLLQEYGKTQPTGIMRGEVQK